MPFADGSRTKGEGRGTGELLLTLLTRRENRLDCQTRRSDGREGGRGTTASLLSSFPSLLTWAPSNGCALSPFSTSPKIHPPSSVVVVSLPLVSFVRSPAESECGVADDNVPRKPFLLRRACARRGRGRFTPRLMVLLRSERGGGHSHL